MPGSKDISDDFSSSQIVLFADFDSGNMAKYERVVRTLSNSTTGSVNGQQASTGQANTQSLPTVPSNNSITSKASSAISNNTGTKLLIFFKNNPF